MKTNIHIKKCGGTDGRPILGLTPDGKLWKMNSCEDWEEMKFNEIYQGYYPTCSFTALECFDQGFFAAGLSEEDGYPYVFGSLLGGVWDQLNLIGKSPISDYVRVTGKVNGILCDENTNQVFLLCDNGELVTLPDCPKCVRIKRVAEVGIKEGYINGEALQLMLENGEKLRVPLHEAVQFRISVSYATHQLTKTGGSLVDLRGEERQSVERRIEGGISVLPLDVPDWLNSVPKDAFIAFFCSYGINADDAVRYARSKGYSNAYSLGGIKQFFHVD